MVNNSEESDINTSVKQRDTSSRSKRRSRTQFSKQQVNFFNFNFKFKYKIIKIIFNLKKVDCLEAIFQKSHYPEVHVVDRISEKLGLSIERISVWFQNRRAKFKKTKKPTSSTDSSFKQDIYEPLQSFKDDLKSSTLLTNTSSVTKPLLETSTNLNNHTTSDNVQYSFNTEATPLISYPVNSLYQNDQYSNENAYSQYTANQWNYMQNYNSYYSS